MENHKAIKKYFYTVLFIICCVNSIWAQSAGHSDIQVSTNDNGGVECNLPLMVPPGTAGMTPSLTLYYNSQSAEGLAGYGWSISGLSVIERVPKNIYYDGRISAISMDTTDRFTLDGKRLVVVNGQAYGSNNCIYGTEEESFMRITASNNSYLEPEYFLLTMDDGSVARYAASELTSRLHWYMDSIADKNGNYIRYHFRSINNSLRIDSICYTGNAVSGQKPYHSICFSYEQMNANTEIKYVAGMEIIQKNILRDIFVLCHQDTVRRYHLTYNTSQSYPLLTQIQEFGQDNKFFAPINIEYGLTEYNSWTSINKKNVAQQRLLSGNYFHTDSNMFMRTWIGINSIMVEDTNGQHGMIVGPWPRPSGGNYTTIRFNALTCDVDASDLDEIILNVAISSNNSTSNYDIGKVYWCRYNQNIAKWDTTHLLPDNTQPDQVLFGNFDDNPMLDYLFVCNGVLWIYPNFCHPQSTSSATILHIDQQEKLESIDIDGDGIMELLVINPQNGGQVYKNAYSQNINFQLFNCSLPNLSFNPNERMHKYFGDVNGDGITDILIPQPKPPYFDTTVWCAYLGNGNGNYTDRYFSNIDGNIPSDDMIYLQLVDINGDGMDDIVYVYEINNITNTSSMSFYLSVAFEKSMPYNIFHTDLKYSLSTSKYPDVPPVFVDGDKDGIVDIAWVAKNTGAIQGKTAKIKKKYASKIIDSYGNTYTFDCMSKSIRTDIRTNLNSTSSGLRTKMILLKNMKKTMGNPDSTLLVNKYYSYSNSLYDYNKRAFLGFMTVAAVDSVQNYYDTSYYTFNTNYRRLLPSAYKKYALSEQTIFNNNQMCDYTYIYTIQGLPNGLSKTYLCAASLNNNGITQTITNFINSSTGRTIKTTTASIGGNWEEEKNTSYTQVPLNDGRTLTKPTSEIHRKKIANSSLLLCDTVKYEYSNGDLTRERTYIDGRIYTTQYTYHPVFGTLSSCTTGTASTRTETYEYDSLHRFVIQKTQPYGYTQQWTYHPAYGKPLTETDYNGNVSTYSYDEFGRLKQSNFPDHSSERLVYKQGTMWGVSHPDIKYCIFRYHNDIIVSTSYFNALDQEIITKQDNRFFEKRYDIKGRLTSESTPYTNSDNIKYWYNYTYNAMDLLEKETGPYLNKTYTYQNIYSSNAIRTILFDSLRNRRDYKTSAYSGITTEIKTDVGGSQENCSQFSYSAEMKNNLPIMKTSVITNSTSTTRTFTNAKGLQVETFDTDAGTTNTAYYEFDEIISHTDANGNTAVYNYDSLGRATQIIYNNEDDIVYQYDNSNIKGTLLSESFDGNAVIYAYDTLARTVSKTYLPDGQDSMTFHYSYHPQTGQLNNITYPGGLSLTHNYDAWDRLISVLCGDTVLYKASYSGKYFVPQRIQKGNTATVMDFNSYGKIISRIAGKGHYEIDNGIPIYGKSGGDPSLPVPTTFVMDDSSICQAYYTYDSAGRIIMIANHPPLPPSYIYTYNDNDYQSEEYFAYDPLDRLTFNGRMNVKHTQISFGNISFDAIFPVTDTLMYMNYTGVKMTANSAVGGFDYASGRAHAIGSVQPVNDSIISADQCDITYNIFNKTHTINEAGKRYTIDYYPNQQRAMTTYSVNNTEQEKKIYCGREYEHDLTTNTQYNYIYVGDMPVALYVQGDTNAMYTLHTNYIGSIEKITNTAGEIVDSMSYTPFGQRRLYSDWSKTDTATHLIDRGFTGQQHLDNFALINFNGRMYDPVLAHFLSPDPYIQSPENPLNYNRYAYCLFSPLQYVDPSGLLISEHVDKYGNIIAHYDDGDNSVYLHADGITKADIDKQRELNNNTGGNGIKIGELGTTIDVSTILQNKLEQSAKFAAKMKEMDIVDRYVSYFEKVKPTGDWDLKSNTKTIWGVAWKYDDVQGDNIHTTFSCDYFSGATAADVGNFHAGYTGIIAGFSKYILWKGAGGAETYKAFEHGHIVEGFWRLHGFISPLNLKSGDRWKDFKFNTKGMNAAKKIIQ